MSNGIALALQSGEVIVAQCSNIKSTKTKLTTTGINLIILDINLHDGSGLDLLREVKQKYNSSVILLTANDMEIDVVGSALEKYNNGKMNNVK